MITATGWTDKNDSTDASLNDSIDNDTSYATNTGFYDLYKICEESERIIDKIRQHEYIYTKYQRKMLYNKPQDKSKFFNVNVLNKTMQRRMMNGRH